MSEAREALKEFFKDYTIDPEQEWPSDRTCDDLINHLMGTVRVDYVRQMCGTYIREFDDESKIEINNCCEVSITEPIDISKDGLEVWKNE